MNFKPGDLVVCVDASVNTVYGHQGGLAQGSVYAVAEFCSKGSMAPNGVVLTSGDGVTLQELAPPESLSGMFKAERFRPVHSIQIFHDIANGVKQPEKENA